MLVCFNKETFYYFLTLKLLKYEIRNYKPKKDA